MRWDAQTRALPLAQMDTRLAIPWSRSVTGTPTTLTLSQDTAGRSLVSCVVAEEVGALPVVRVLVGVAVGVQDVAVLRTAEKKHG